MGTHMVEVLAEAGHEIVATDLPDAYRADDKRRGRFPSVLRTLGVEFIPADLTQALPETLAALCKDVDYIFHVASVFSYSAPWRLLKRVNVEGTRALLDQARDNPRLRRVVVWGAGGVYGLPDPDDLPLREDTSPPAPCNAYLRSKWLEEHLVMRYGLPYTILRPTTVYGPRAVYGGGQLLMSAATMPVVAVPRNFTARIPFVHARDVCRAALFLAEKEEANGEVYNLNDDSQLTTFAFFEFVAKVRGKKFVSLPPVPIETLRRVALKVADVAAFFSRLTGLPVSLERDSIEYLGRDFVYSNEKLKQTGFQFLYPDARDGIRDTLKWYELEGWI